MVKELRNKTWEQIKNERIAIVKVFTTWCGPCKMLKSKFVRWSESNQVYNGTKIKYYEVDGDKCKSFTSEYEIDRYPTTLFFVYGVVVFKQYGMGTESTHNDLLKQTLEIKYERSEDGI